MTSKSTPLPATQANTAAETAATQTIQDVISHEEAKQRILAGEFGPITHGRTYTTFERDGNESIDHYFDRLEPLTDTGYVMSDKDTERMARSVSKEIIEGQEVYTEKRNFQRTKRISDGRALLKAYFTYFHEDRWLTFVS